MNRAPKGFTLIELLVVIAIIALLLSIVTPALRKTREAGRRILCAAHMHQVGLSIQMYANENKGFVPLHDSEQSTGRYWMTYMYTQKVTNLGFLVDGYIPVGSDIIFCPSNRVLRGIGTVSGFNEYVRQDDWWSAWLNKDAEWAYLPTSSEYRNLYCEESIKGKLYRAGNKVILSDWFTNLSKTNETATWAPKGVLEHHQIGYTVLNTDNSVDFVKDPAKTVYDLGVKWDTNNDEAKVAWRFLEGNQQ
ncbi:MAG: type II secretion system GspH family protein [Planctomycetaceae bacterium]|nr:type II secretion system GspH family protein [Planctomycetaceae bacterium]